MRALASFRRMELLDKLIGNATATTLLASGGIFAILHAVQVVLPIPHSTFIENTLNIDYAVEQISASPKSVILVLILFWLIWSLPLFFYRATKSNRFKFMAILFLACPLALDLVWAYELEWGGELQSAGFVNVGLLKHIVFGVLGYILAVKYLWYKANKLSQQDAASGAAA